MLLKIFFKSISKRFIAILCVCLFAFVWSSFLINNWYRDFYPSISSNASGLFNLIFLFVLYNLLSHISLSIKELSECSISLKWRIGILKHVIRKINPPFIQVDNPDQRLCQDSQEFTDIIVKLISDFILNIILLIVFVFVIVNLLGIYIGFQLILGMLIYTLICNKVFIVYMQKKLINLGEQYESNEACLRSNVYEIHKSKYGFDLFFKRQSIFILRKLLVQNYMYYIYKSIVTFYQKFVDDNLGMIMPYILLLIISKSSFGDIGIVMQTVNCIVMIKFRMMFFSENIHKIYQCKVGYIRLKKYIENVLKDNKMLKYSKSDDFNVCIKYIKAGNITLLENFSCTIKKGDTLSLYGKSGIGKTTLLRYMNNSIIHDGEGKISYNGSIRFLCVKNIQNYINLNLNKRSDYFSQGELQKECISCLINEEPKWIVWDEFCLGLSEEEKNKEFNRLKTNLPNAGIILLSQDILHFCANSVALEGFKS